MKPCDVNKGNARELFEYLSQKRKQIRRKSKNRFSLGDLVRIPLNPSKTTDFRKGYSPKWSRAIYQVDEIYFGKLVPMYYIIGPEGKRLPRRYYENELNLVVSFEDLSLE
jgi:hypothetical protein